MTQVDALRAGATALGLTLSDRQSERLLAYGALILKWNKVYNLTALRDPELVLSHHLLDSMAVIEPLRRERPTGGKLLDVGAGAGLPGVVIAILCENIDVSCLDAVAKKAAFVQQVAAELKLPNLRGVHARVESLAGQFDIVSSRAFASLPDFFNGSAQLVAPNGLWLAMKGKVPSDELAMLPANVDVFHVEQLSVPGLDAERCIVWARPKATVAA
jgi:16S rRNA (guanine527-N7)-methyltransferase